MFMDIQKKGKPYADLQLGVDRLISKFGISKTLRIMDHLLGNRTLQTSKKQKAQVLTAFIISESKRLYGCEEESLCNENSKEFREARMVAYYLIKKYTNMSYQELGKQFGQSKRAAIHHYQKCKDVLSIPQFHKDFVAIYDVLEENILQFIAKIN